jgi:sugar/nucleoside kinase (ribokinase family)
MNPMPIQELQIFAAGSLQLDMRVEPLFDEFVDEQRQERITLCLGGTPAHIARTLRPSGYHTTVFGSQHPRLHPWLTDEFAKLGATALLRPRSDALGANIILPGEADRRQVLVRSTTLGRGDLDDEAIGFLRQAHLTIAGPMPIESDGGDTPALLRAIGRLSGNSVLLPHPTLLQHPTFAEIARLYNCVILNAEKAALLSPERPEVVFSALKFRRLLGDRSEFLITNGCGQGLQYADGNWRKMNPHKIGECTDNVGAGDTLAAYYAEGRYLRGLEPGLALERALAGVALYLQARNRCAGRPTNATALLRNAAVQRKSTRVSAQQPRGVRQNIPALR